MYVYVELRCVLRVKNTDYSSTLLYDDNRKFQRPARSNYTRLAGGGEGDAECGEIHSTCTQATFAPNIADWPPHWWQMA